MDHQGLGVFHAWPWLLSLPSYSTFLHDLKRKEEYVEREIINYQRIRKDHETASTQQIIDEPLCNAISTIFISCCGADDMDLNADKWLNERVYIHPSQSSARLSVNTNEPQAKDQSSLIRTKTAF